VSSSDLGRTKAVTKQIEQMVARYSRCKLQQLGKLDQNILTEPDNAQEEEEMLLKESVTKEGI